MPSGDHPSTFARIHLPFFMLSSCIEQEYIFVYKCAHHGVFISWTSICFVCSLICSFIYSLFHSTNFWLPGTPSPVDYR